MSDVKDLIMIKTKEKEEEYLNFIKHHRESLKIALRLLYEKTNKIGLDNMPEMDSILEQLDVHDVSKETEPEFSIYRKKYRPSDGELFTDDDVENFKLATTHHFTNNKHHWEHWVKYNKDGYHILDIPFNYIVEMYLDWSVTAARFNNSVMDWYVGNFSKMLLTKKTRDFLEPMILISTTQKNLSDNKMCNDGVIFENFKITDGMVSDIVEIYNDIVEKQGTDPTKFMEIFLHQAQVIYIRSLGFGGHSDLILKSINSKYPDLIKATVMEDINKRTDHSVSTSTVSIILFMSLIVATEYSMGPNDNFIKLCNKLKIPTKPESLAAHINYEVADRWENGKLKESRLPNYKYIHEECMICIRKLSDHI